MHKFRKISYEVVQVGEEFMSNDHLVTAEDIEGFAFAVDDHDPWYGEDAPSGEPIAHPTILANQALMMRHSKYIVDAGLHAKMEFDFQKPIVPGMRVRSRGKVIDKYERRGRHYMVTEFITSDEDTGDVLLRGQFTQMIFPESGVHRAS